MDIKTKTPAPADKDTWRFHWEIVDRLEAMTLEAIFDDNNRSDEVTTSLGLLLNFIEDALYRVAMEPPTERNELSRSLAGALLADHYGRVLRDAEAARKANLHSRLSKIWKLSHGVKGAPANEVFKEVLERPTPRKGRSNSSAMNWFRTEIVVAAHQHQKQDVLHLSGLRLPRELGVFGANESEKEAWRYWMMSMLSRRFRDYAEQPEHLREESTEAPPPTWRNHQGSTAQDAFENEWKRHAWRQRKGINATRGT
jgi:hypothetical protein